MRKLFVTILILFLHYTSYAQVESKPELYNFEHITDTIQFAKGLKALQKIIVANKIEESLVAVNQMIKSGVELEYDKGLGQAYWYKGRIEQNNKEIFKAIQSYELAESYFSKANYLQGLAWVYNDRFVLEYNKGNIEKSADYLLESKMYYEKLADSSGLMVVYNNLGNVHETLKKYESSEIFFRQSIAIRKKKGLLKDIGIVMNNLALVYSKNKKTEEAKSILKESLMLNKKYSLTEPLAHSYSIMAEVALYEKEYELAEKYYDTTLQIANTANFDRLINTAKQQLGYLEMVSKNYDRSDKLLTVVRKEFKDSESTQLLLKNYQYSSQLDSARGNLSGALIWQKRYQQLSDNKMTEMSTKKIERAEARYQSELEQLRTIDEQEIREQRNTEQLFRYRIMTLVILGVLSICLLFALWIIRTRKERKGLISKLNTSNEVKNKLFSIISHDLKNEIHGLESSLNLMKDDEISTEEFDEIVPLLADRTNQTSILLNNLLNWSKSQMKELSAKPVSFDVSEVISNKFVFFKPKANQKNIKLINLLNSTNVHADKDMVGIVAQNLIANAIKFCKPGDTISLISRENDDHYEIGFADTGVGIDPVNLNKLFAEETFTTHGTQNESGTGLGLRICRELIELNSGSIRVESTLGVGSTFFITLPKANA